MTIQPIETRYAGCRFRSRLEARWAVFFDALKVQWEYEPQGFHVGPDRRPYLPDFKLTRARHKQPLWVEVKGSDEALDAELLGKAASAESGVGGPILILGPVPEPSPAPLHAVIRDVFGHPCVVRGLLGAELGILQIAREHELGSPKAPKYLVSGATASAIWTMPEVVLCDQLADAYRAARCARFEHGERG